MTSPCTRELPDPLEEPTVTVGRASRILGISQRTLYQAVLHDEFPCIRIRGRIVISTRYLLGLLDGHSEG